MTTNENRRQISPRYAQNIGIKRDLGRILRLLHALEVRQVRTETRLCRMAERLGLDLKTK